MLSSTNITKNVPTFSGSYYDQWLSFCDSFESIINSNSSLSKNDKFQYLRSSLAGEALQSIQCLETSPENYDLAWEILTQKYNNTRAIIQNHLKGLYDITPISKRILHSIETIN